VLYLMSYGHRREVLKPVNQALHRDRKVGRGREIRTPDILLPKQARYQTALYPDSFNAGVSAKPRFSGGRIILTRTDSVNASRMILKVARRLNLPLGGPLVGQYPHSGAGSTL
jgi:hypothetical protein